MQVSGRDPCPGTVGAHRRLFHGRPRTGRAGGVSGLDVRARVGRRSPGVRPARVIARDEGGRDGRCPDGWAGGAGERDACRAGGAGAGRRRACGRLAGPGHRCGDTAVLPGSFSREVCGTAARAPPGRGSLSRSGREAVRSGWRSLTGAPRSAGLGPAGRDAEGGRRLQLVAGLAARRCGGGRTVTWPELRQGCPRHAAGGSTWRVPAVDLAQ
jgi:hypothetical protein